MTDTLQLRVGDRVRVQFAPPRQRYSYVGTIRWIGEEWIEVFQNKFRLGPLRRVSRTARTVTVERIP